MARPRKLIKASTVAEMLDCSARTVKRMGFKQIPMNPKAKRVTWMFEQKEVEAFIENRMRLGK